MKKILFSLLMTVLLTAFLVRYVDFGHLLDVLSKIDLFWVSAVFASFIVYQYLRVLRFNLLTGQKLQTLKAVCTMSVQSPINATLPAGLGEVSLVYLLKRFHDVDWRQGTGSVILARLADLVTFVLFFLIAVLFAHDVVPDKVTPFMLGLAGLLFLGITVLVGLSLWRLKYQNQPSSALWGHIDLILAHIRSVRKLSIYVRLFTLTAAMWTVMYFLKVFTVYALNFNLSLATILWIYIIPIDLLPIKGIANLGTYEAAWFAVLIFLGHPAEMAALLAFGSHIIIFSVRIIAGLAGLLGLTILCGQGKTLEVLEEKGK